MKKTLNPLLLKKLVSSPVMIVFITDVDISTRANLFNLKQTISPWYGIINVISTVIARTLFTYWCVTLVNGFIWDKQPIYSRELENANQMFFTPRIFFARNIQNIYAIVAEWKNLFLEYARFYMRIKRNYASLKKTVTLWDGNHS